MPKISLKKSTNQLKWLTQNILGDYDDCAVEKTSYSPSWVPIEYIKIQHTKLSIEYEAEFWIGS